ncbi:MAG: hypothetical protein M1818_005127 [Claussenomyces sp. TS43310]|nr:MAG: hypothetical protein M1818_005127 [Claussenomyces sp. TS43310]
MTNRRVNDLSYGHLGEASYDARQQEWSFSRTTSLDRPIRPIQPLQTSIPPSIRDPPETSQSYPKAWTAPKNWLRKAIPEAETAVSLLSSLGRSENASSTVHQSGSLLAVGQAFGLHKSGSSALGILAIPHGEAGDVLRLIKPRTCHLWWEDHKGITLRSWDPAVSEDGYWMGLGGAIQQIAFGTGSDGPTSWLAVRKRDATTILRPIYHPLPVPLVAPIGSATRFLPSRLDPNEILTLSSDKTGLRPHVDVTFNPWYIRQFAVLDQGGYWSIWDVEGQQRKRRTFEPLAGRSGHIYDKSGISQEATPAEGIDGWGRLLWAGGVGTLVVCNRHHVAVYDLKVKPRLMRGSNVDIVGVILEMMRSPVRLNHIFLLTTSHLFWLEITQAGEDSESEHGGAKVLLSCRHFRDVDGQSLRLQLMDDNEGMGSLDVLQKAKLNFLDCIALIYSSASVLVHTFRFSMTIGDTATHCCVSDAFTIASEPEHTRATSNPFQDLTMIPLSLVTDMRTSPSGPGVMYRDDGIAFYQLVSLNSRLGLSQALCATTKPLKRVAKATSIEYLHVEPPKTRSCDINATSSLHVRDDFVVPDGLEEFKENMDRACNFTHRPNDKGRARRHSRVREIRSIASYAHRMFEIAFLDTAFNVPGARLTEQGTITACIRHIAQSLRDRCDHAVQGTNTALELSGFAFFSEDVDEAAAALHEVLEDFSRAEDVEYPLGFVMSRVKPALPRQKNADPSESEAHLSTIYDNLVASWVSCLPDSAPGPSRIAKERLVRSIAAELCLGSVVMTFYDKSAKIARAAEPEEAEEEIRLPAHRAPDAAYDSQPTKLESQDFAGQSSSLSRGLLTPAQTPSVVSQDGSVYSEGIADDNSIERLRDYAISIKSQRPLGSAGSTVLSHWPSVPGADPWRYSWDATNKALGRDHDLGSDDDDDERRARRRREEDRRRRRTERFLQRQQADDALAIPSSQRVIATSFRSDPIAPPQAASSSQAHPSLGFPMSQPVTGAFGSRTALKGAKKRRTKGF